MQPFPCETKKRRRVTSIILLDSGAGRSKGRSQQFCHRNAPGSHSSLLGCPPRTHDLHSLFPIRVKGRRGCWQRKAAAGFSACFHTKTHRKEPGSGNPGRTDLRHSAAQLCLGSHTELRRGINPSVTCLGRRCQAGLWEQGDELLPPVFLTGDQTGFCYAPQINNGKPNLKSFPAESLPKEEPAAQSGSPDSGVSVPIPNMESDETSGQRDASGAARPAAQQCGAGLTTSRDTADTAASVL